MISITGNMATQASIAYHALPEEGCEVVEDNTLDIIKRQEVEAMEESKVCSQEICYICGAKHRKFKRVKFRNKGGNMSTNVCVAKLLCRRDAGSYMYNHRLELLVYKKEGEKL